MRPPVPALILGAAGLLPALGAVVVTILAKMAGTQLVANFAIIGGLAYGGVILSFLGGLWCGMAAVAAPRERLTSHLLLAVAPPLVAFVALALSTIRPVQGGILLALAIAATLPIDRRLQQKGVAPAWWFPLRLPLSVGLAGLMLLLSFLA